MLQPYAWNLPLEYNDFWSYERYLKPYYCFVICDFAVLMLVWHVDSVNRAHKMKYFAWLHTVHSRNLSHENCKVKYDRHFAWTCQDTDMLSCILCISMANLKKINPHLCRRTIGLFSDEEKLCRLATNYRYTKKGNIDIYNFNRPLHNKILYNISIIITRGHVVENLKWYPRLICCYRVYYCLFFGFAVANC